MSPLEHAALKLWNAAVFHRRAPDRDQSIANQIIAQAAQSKFDAISARAHDILKGNPQ